MQCVVVVARLVVGSLTGVPLQLGDAYTVTEAGRAEAWNEYVRASKSSRGNTADIFHAKRHRWPGLIAVMRRDQVSRQQAMLLRCCRLGLAVRYSSPIEVKRYNPIDNVTKS